MLCGYLTSIGEVYLCHLKVFRYESILRAIKDAGYEKPTDIQSRAIPEAIAGNDLMASAQTGTGKTAAFVIPALERLLKPSPVRNSKGPRILVLTQQESLRSKSATQPGSMASTLSDWRSLALLEVCRTFSKEES